MKLQDLFETTRSVYWISPNGENLLSAGFYHFTYVMMNPETFGLDLSHYKEEIDREAIDYAGVNNVDNLSLEQLRSLYDRMVDGVFCEKIMETVLSKGWLRTYGTNAENDTWSIYAFEKKKSIATGIETFFRLAMEGKFSIRELTLDSLVYISYVKTARINTTVGHILKGYLEEAYIPHNLPEGRFLFYWLGPDAKLIDIRGEGSHYHFTYVMQHPTVFGLTEKEVQDAVKKHMGMMRLKTVPSFDDIRDGEVSDEILEKVYSNHWIRLSFDYTDWAAFCSSLDAKNKVTLELFCRNLINHKYPIPEFFANSQLDIEIFPLDNGTDDVKMRIGSVARGSLEESVDPMRLTELNLSDTVRSITKKLTLRKRKKEQETQLRKEFDDRMKRISNETQ